MSTSTLKKCSAQQQIDHSENIASPAGVSRGARISSLREEILACEQQTYFRSSLLSLQRRRPEIRLLFAGNLRRRFYGSSYFISLRTADVFPVVASLPLKVRENTTGESFSKGVMEYNVWYTLDNSYF